jgi:hypothetical protein
VEHFVCLHAPAGFCVGTYEEGDVQEGTYSSTDIKEATLLHRTRLKWPAERFLASPEEAHRRALICTKCPDNKRGICTTCNGLADFAKRVVGARSTDLDHSLGVCSVCKCMLSVKVHISAEALRAVRAKKKFDVAAYPECCWMKEVLA